ncbi:MAG: GNAT family N-acetyltransferase [Rhodothermales bacterium]|nr:GNAT family N-acetyltransferase [Rhodothermales bacterium]MBO6779895.1 GNAT family N-acetyltransferase [Rhodothermales bacterium]
MIRPLDRNSDRERSRWGELRIALFPDLDPAFNDADMAALLARDEQEVLLAFSGDEVVGFAEVALRNLVDGCLTSPVGYLEGIYLVPGHRGKGLSRQLLEAAMGWARAQGCSEFASDSSLDETEAQAWHRRVGFEETYRIVQFRREL